MNVTFDFHHFPQKLKKKKTKPKKNGICGILPKCWGHKWRFLPFFVVLFVYLSNNFMKCKLVTLIELSEFL